MLTHIRMTLLGIALLALSASHWKCYKLGQRSIEAEWAQERYETLQMREKNREAAHAVEVRHFEREKIRVETIKEITKELPNELENLNGCRLDAGDIGLLNRAASTAREN